MQYRQRQEAMVQLLDGDRIEIHNPKVAGYLKRKKEDGNYLERTGNEPVAGAALV